MAGHGHPAYKSITYVTDLSRSSPDVNADFVSFALSWRKPTGLDRAERLMGEFFSLLLGQPLRQERGRTTYFTCCLNTSFISI